MFFLNIQINKLFVRIKSIKLLILTLHINEIGDVLFAFVFRVSSKMTNSGWMRVHSTIRK